MNPEAGAFGQTFPHDYFFLECVSMAELDYRGFLF